MSRSLENIGTSVLWETRTRLVLSFMSFSLILTTTLQNTLIKVLREGFVSTMGKLSVHSVGGRLFNCFVFCLGQLCQRRLLTPCKPVMGGKQMLFRDCWSNWATNYCSHLSPLPPCTIARFCMGRRRSNPVLRGRREAGVELQHDKEGLAKSAPL